MMTLADMTSGTGSNSLLPVSELNWFTGIYSPLNHMYVLLTLTLTLYHLLSKAKGLW